MKSQSSMGRILSAFLLAAGTLGAAQAGAAGPLGQATRPPWGAPRDVRSRVGPDLCLDVEGGAAKEDTNVWLFTCNGTPAQKWTLTPEGYLRSDVGPKRCLDVKDRRTADGTNVRIHHCNGTPAQRWNYTERGELRSAVGNNLCLDVNGGSAQPKTNVQLYTCNGTVAQQWFDVPRLPVFSTQGPSITINNINLNGMDTSFVRVKPNQLIPMKISYTISQDPKCQDCTQQIAIGFAGTFPGPLPGTFQGCIYDGRPSTSGTPGQATGQLAAPGTPGVYYLRFKPAGQPSCSTVVWSDTNESNNLAAIMVTES